MKMARLLLTFLVTTYLFACGGSSPQVSETKYLKNHDFPAWATGNRISSICVFGTGANESNRQWVSGALFDWLVHLRVFKSFVMPFFDVIDGTSEADCRNKRADLIVEISRSNARAHVDRNGVVRLYTGAGNNYYVALHEAGHVLGLGDTYIEGVWSCKPGQPPSIMCNYNNQTSQFSPDDVLGIQDLYCSRYNCERKPDPTTGYMEVGVNRQGSDFLNTPLGSDVECSLLCRNNAQCQAWTFHNNVCWLKSGIPAPSNYPGATSGVKGHVGYDIALMRDHNLGGQDYMNFEISHPEACRSECLVQSQCKAFTWVPEDQRCWLKSGVPVPSAWPGLYSGFKF